MKGYIKEEKEEEYSSEEEIIYEKESNTQRKARHQREDEIEEFKQQKIINSTYSFKLNQPVSKWAESDSEDEKEDLTFFN